MLTKAFRKIKLIILKFKHKDISIGKNTIIDFDVEVIIKSSKVIIGDNVYLRAISKGYQASMPFPTTLLLDVKDAILKIGSNSRINGAYIHAQKQIEIGENCVIASGVNIMDSNGHLLNSSNRTKGRDNPEPVILGNNVWVGLNAVILKGTKIGDNCVISAGSVVKGEFPANTLITGVPAKVVKEITIK